MTKRDGHFHTQPYLQERWARVGRKLAFSCESRKQAAPWRAKAAGKLKHDIFEGEHRWNGVKAIPWMRRHLA